MCSPRTVSAGVSMISPRRWIADAEMLEVLPHLGKSQYRLADLTSQHIESNELADSHRSVHHGART